MGKRMTDFQTGLLIGAAAAAFGVTVGYLLRVIRQEHRVDDEVSPWPYGDATPQDIEEGRY